MFHKGKRRRRSIPFAQAEPGASSSDGLSELARIVLKTSLDDAPGMEEQPTAPAHRVDLGGYFLRHPMPMNLPVETEMPEKTLAFALRRSRPERVGVRPEAVDRCLPSASRADPLADCAQNRSRRSRGARRTRRSYAC